MKYFPSTIVATASLALAASAIIGCGASAPAQEETTVSKVEEADRAIAIIRDSYEAMGGLQRLRLTQSKVHIDSTVTAGKESFKVRTSYDGPGRRRLDFVDTGVSYLLIDGECRKELFGVTVDCTEEERRWIEPASVLQGLIFPAGDAAKLNSTFRMREDTVVDGTNCVVPEIRPKGTKIKMRSAYDKSTGLLKRVKFYFKDESEKKLHWSVIFGDWREVDLMKVPFSMVVRSGQDTVWTEVVDEVDFKGYDSRAFEPHLPPTNDQPLLYSFPERRLKPEKVLGLDVETLAPHATIGAGAQVTEGQTAPAAEVMRMIHSGPLPRAKEHFKKLLDGVKAAGRIADSEPSVLLLEHPEEADSPVLMIIYVPLKAKSTSVQVNI